MSRGYWRLEKTVDFLECLAPLIACTGNGKTFPLLGVGCIRARKRYVFSWISHFLIDDLMMGARLH
jgi:hypothetical protein